MNKKRIPARDHVTKNGSQLKYGKICPKHPEADGERYLSNSMCVECSRKGQHTQYNRLKDRLNEALELLELTTHGLGGNDVVNFLRKAKDWKL